MENFDQPSQENLIAFTRDTLERAAHPLTQEDQELAHFLETANAEDTNARENFLHRVLAAKLFTDRNEARAWSDALFKNIVARRVADIGFAALIAAAPELAKASTRALQQQQENGFRESPSTTQRHSVIAKYDLTEELHMPRFQQQPQSRSVKSLTTTEKSTLKSSSSTPFNVQAAKQQVEDKRSGQTQSGQQQQPQEPQQENAQQRHQEQTTRSRKKGGMGIFKKTMIGTGIAVLGGATFGWIAIFNVIR